MVTFRLEKFGLCIEVDVQLNNLPKVAISNVLLFDHYIARSVIIILIYKLQNDVSRKFDHIAMVTTWYNACTVPYRLYFYMTSSLVYISYACIIYT